MLDNGGGGGECVNYESKHFPENKKYKHDLSCVSSQIFFAYKTGFIKKILLVRSGFVWRVATFLSKAGLELEINFLHLRPQLFPITGAPLAKLVQDGAETKIKVYR